MYNFYILDLFFVVVVVVFLSRQWVLNINYTNHPGGNPVHKQLHKTVKFDVYIQIG